MESYQKKYKETYYRIRFSPCSGAWMDSDRTSCCALICPFLQAAVLVKATVVLCTGGYAGLIFGFFGGIFYIYRGTVKKSHTAVNSVPSVSFR